MQSSPARLAGQREPRQRVIVLGASNVARNMTLVVETARQVWQEPLDVFTAVGHGRSYGKPSRVLGRSLPGILQCDLWQDLQAQTPLPTAALVTDIGNDILFGAAPDQIAAWVEDCLRRLRETCQRTVVTELPLESVSRVGPAKFLAFRTMLFPKSRVTWDQAMRAARELNGHVIEVAGRYGATVIRPLSDWYGLDPIHIRYRRSCEAWNHILTPWGAPRAPRACPPNWRDRLRWWGARPKYRRMFGREQQREQPAVRLPDGTRVSLY
ncbi:MAG: SGNH/GDSL hydrolase family protein [Pirellulaceae bacterium]